MSEYSKLNFTDGTLLTAAMMNQLSDNIEYALETPPPGLNVNGKSPDETKKITITAADVGARADDWMPTAADVGALSGTDATLTQAGKAADAKATGDALDRLSQPRKLTFSLPVSAWAGESAFVAEIAESSVTAQTWIEIAPDAASEENYSKDIVWETSAGRITLTTTAKPTGTLAGTMILTEVEGE